MNLREQGAERLAKSVMDAYATEALMGYARECRELAARPADLSTSQTPPDGCVRYCLIERHGATTGTL
jgi:hypothetical protein